jgi:hypothetical protein
MYILYIYIYVYILYVYIYIYTVYIYIHAVTWCYIYIYMCVMYMYIEIHVVYQHSSTTNSRSAPGRPIPRTPVTRLMKRDAPRIHLPHDAGGRIRLGSIPGWTSGRRLKWIIVDPGHCDLEKSVGDTRNNAIKPPSPIPANIYRWYICLPFPMD